jgi:hypothetical protein
MYDMILHYTIDIQKREDANRCSSYVELVVVAQVPKVDKHFFL